MLINDLSLCLLINDLSLCLLKAASHGPQAVRSARDEPDL